MLTFMDPMTDISYTSEISSGRSALGAVDEPSGSKFAIYFPLRLSVELFCNDGTS